MQYNDPDFFVWIGIYLILSSLSLIAAVRPDFYRRKPVFVILPIFALIGCVYGFIHYYPSIKPGWIDIEEAREGLGLAISSIGMLMVIITIKLHKKPSDGAH